MASTLRSTARSATVPAPGPLGHPLVPTRSAGPSGLSRRLRLRTALERRNRLVELHRALVRPLAVHYCRCTPEPLEDLIQVGLMGLIRAAERYERSQGTPFEAFARPHIRGAILHHLRDCAPAVRLPRRQAELQDKLLRLQRQRLQASTVTTTLHTELQTLGIGAEEAGLLLRQRRLNRPMALLPEHEELIPTPLADDHADDHEASCLETPRAGAEALLAELEQRERRVIEQVVLAGESYRAVARQMQVSPMTVQRLLQRGLDQLRQQLDGGWGGSASVDPAWGVASDLLLQGADRRIEGSQTPLRGIAPGGEQAKLVGLMLAPGRAGIEGRTATEGKHGMESPYRVRF
jgi:RNA polymerase sigma-B factor